MHQLNTHCSIGGLLLSASGDDWFGPVVTGPCTHSPPHGPVLSLTSPALLTVSHTLTPGGGRRAVRRRGRGHSRKGKGGGAFKGEEGRVEGYLKKRMEERRGREEGMDI